jgi:hypothetical protein
MILVFVGTGVWLLVLIASLFVSTDTPGGTSTNHGNLLKIKAE